MELIGPRPLDRGDDRSQFDCGRAVLNEWFARHAWANHDGLVSRVSVVCDRDGRIVGFVSLSASQIERGFLPKPMQRSRPDPLPTTLIGRLAVDRDFQGRGLASDLLAFAIRTAFASARRLASFAVVVHPLDEGVRKFYAGRGFADCPFDPRRSMILRMSDVELGLRTIGAPPR